MSRKLIAGLIAVVFLLAGCVGDDDSDVGGGGDGDPADPDNPDQEQGGEGNGTVEPREPNPVQEGTVNMCIRNHPIIGWGNVVGFIEDAFGDGELVEFESLTHYQVEADGEVQIAFMNEGGGRNLQYGATGLVPAESEGEPVVKAAVCVYDEPPGGQPADEARVLIPREGTSFTYQDGLPDPEEPPSEEE